MICSIDFCDRPRHPRKDRPGQFYPECHEHFKERNRKNLQMHRAAKKNGHNPKVYDKNNKPSATIEYQRQKNRESYERHKEERIAKTRAYPKTDQQARKWQKRYHSSAKGKESLRTNMARRRSRKRNAFVENIDRQIVWERDKGVCQICKEPADYNNWNLDHIIPLGPGPHCYENVRVTCPNCNRKKIVSDKQELSKWRDHIGQIE